MQSFDIHEYIKRSSDSVNESVRLSDFSSSFDVICTLHEKDVQGFVMLKDTKTVMGFLLHSTEMGIHTIFITDEGRGRGLMKVMLQKYMETHPDVIWDLRGNYNKHMMHWYDQALSILPENAHSIGR